MKHTVLPKLELLFLGLNERFNEKREFFDRCEITFKSGLKTFAGKFYEKDGLFFLFLNGRTEKSDFSALITAILAEAPKYDGLVFTYFERGARITLTADEKGVKSSFSEVKEDISKQLNPMLKDREYLLKIGEADELLKQIGIMTNEGKIKNDMLRKYNQTDRFVELCVPYFDDFGDKTITILDCACGKSYLSFCLNYYLCNVLKKRCHFICIDQSENVINESRKIAKNLHYNNMEFLNEDLRYFDTTKAIDAVISLHACDTATDMALGLGIRKNAKVILSVPCCHNELLDKFRLDGFEPLLKHGIFKARFNDCLTDALRTLKLESCGYDVNACEYISPLDSPKNLLLRAKKRAVNDEQIGEQYSRICKKLGVRPSLDDYSSSY